MTPLIWPPGWLIAYGDELRVGDLIPAIVPGYQVPCLNCSDPDGLMWAWEITSSGPIHWFGSRRRHAALRCAPCAVCR